MLHNKMKIFFNGKVSPQNEFMNVDVKIMNVHYNIGQFLGVTPMKVQNEDKNRKLKLTYVICLFMVMISLLFYASYDKTQYYSQISIQRAILSGTEGFAEFVFVKKCILGALISDKTKWIPLLETLNKVDRNLGAENFIVRLNKKRLLLEIAAYHVMFLALIIYDIQNLYVAKSVFYYQKVCQYYQLFELIFMCALARMIRRRYDFLSKIIRSILRKPAVSHIKSFEQMREEKLKKVFAIYQNLYKISNEFNNIFGWQIFLIITCTVFSLLNHANNAFLTFKGENFMVDIFHVYLLNGVLYPIYYVVTVVVLVMSCDSIEKSAVNVISTCYKNMIHLEKSPFRHDVQIMTKFMDKLIPDITAAGFFKINQFILATIFTSVSTYLIIIIQFE